MLYVTILDGFTCQVHSKKPPVNVNKTGTVVFFEDDTFCNVGARKTYDDPDVTFVDQDDPQYLPAGTESSDDTTVAYVRREGDWVTLEVPGRSTLVTGGNGKFQVNLGNTGDPSRGVQIGHGNTMNIRF